MAKPIDKKDEYTEIQPAEPAAMDASFAAPAAQENKNFVSNGVLKGLAVTALVIIGVMALVAGGMGLGSPHELRVDGALMTTFEQGAMEGLKTGLRFLVEPLGLAALGVGAAFGVVREHRIAKEQAAAAPDSESQKKVVELSQELEFQKTLNQELVHAHEKAPEAGKDVVLASPEANKANDKQDSIHIAGSVIQDSHFRASELKRRVERTNNVEAKAV